MKTRTFTIFTRVFGVVIASLFTLVFTPHVIGDINQNGVEALNDAGRALFNWYDNPTGLFTSFIVGYAIVWWKQLYGALIIILASVVATLINLDNPGWLIFTGPTLIVGVMYLFNCNLIQKKTQEI